MTPRQLLRSCAVSDQLKRLAERAGIFSQPVKTDTPNGTTFLLGAARLVCCAQITAD